MTAFLNAEKLGRSHGGQVQEEYVCVCQALQTGPLIKALILISSFGFCFCPFGRSLSSSDESQKPKRSQVP